jgi:hypothetical protein
MTERSITMERELEKIVEEYKKIGLDKNGIPYDRPPKRPAPKEPAKDYGYTTNGIHTARPVWSKAENSRI